MRFCCHYVLIWLVRKMIKYAFMCIASALLASCASQTNQQYQQPRADNLPEWMLKLKDDDKEFIYADLRTISSYHGNQHLRRLYVITNYPRANHFKSKVFKSIPTMLSTRDSRVINCDTQETVLSEELFFSQYWAEGEVILKNSRVSQWQSIPKGSIMEFLANVACDIEPSSLKAEPAEDTRIPLLDK